MAKNPKSVTGTKEWAAHNVNCCDGCSHNCRYCYARAMALRFKRTTVAKWPREKIRQAEVGKTRRLLTGRVMFPTTHDITPGNLAACLAVLGKLLAAGNEVLIVSKPHLPCIQRLCTALAGYRKQILFRFTIGVMDDTLRAFWEPGAPTFKERLDCLRLAHGTGFATSVSAEPLLEPWNARGLVTRLLPYVTDSIWIGKANSLRQRTYGQVDPNNQTLLRLLEWQTDDKVKQVRGALRGLPLIKWKDSYKKILGIKRPTVAGKDV